MQSRAGTAKASTASATVTAGPEIIFGLPDTSTADVLILFGVEYPSQPEFDVFVCHAYLMLAHLCNLCDQVTKSLGECRIEP